MLAEIAQVPRGGAVSLEISDGEPVELSFTEHRAQSAKVFAEAAEQSPPVLLIVDLEPLERSEPVVRFDEFVRVATFAASRLHLLSPVSEWRDKRAAIARWNAADSGRRSGGERFGMREGDGWP